MDEGVESSGMEICIDRS